MALAYTPASKASSTETDRKRSEEVLYWTRLKEISVIQEPSRISSLCVSPTRPYSAASTSGVRLALYDVLLAEQTSVLSRFKRPIYGVKFRHDGKLIVLGGEEGKMRVFDLFSSGGVPKAPLRSIKASGTPLYGCSFSPSGHSLFGLSDDGALRLFPLSPSAASSSPLREIQAHSDIARVLLPSSISEHIVATGGYDHIVKLWDLRTEGKDAVMQMKCDAPVEAAVYLPNEQVLAAAAGSTLSVFSLSSGGRALSTVTHHHKTVFSLAVSAQGRHLLSAGFDKRLNVIRTSDFQLVHSTSLYSPLMSIALSNDDKFLITGMGNSVGFYARSEATNKEKEKVRERSTVMSNAVKEITVQSKGEEKQKVQLNARRTVQTRLSKEDMMLKNFRHAAFIATTFKNRKVDRHPDMVVGWLRVLTGRPGALSRAIAGQPIPVVSSLILFVRKHLFKEHYFCTLSSVTESLIEVYSSTTDPRVAQSLLQLRAAVSRELGVQKQLCQLIGTLEMLTTPLHGKSETSQEMEDDLFGEISFSTIPLNLHQERIESKSR